MVKGRGKTCRRGVFFLASSNRFYYDFITKQNIKSCLLFITIKVFLFSKFGELISHLNLNGQDLSNKMGEKHSFSKTSSPFL